MKGKHSNWAVASTLLFTIFLWGGNNVGTKWLVQSWPPGFIGCTRFFCAGLLMVGLFRWTDWFGAAVRPSRVQSRQLWLRTGLALAAYIMCFNWAMRLTSAAHVALYLGASPVWALLWEERPQKSWRSLLRYGAAILALAGVVTLFWPALHDARLNPIGELCGIVGSVLWTIYSHESRRLSLEIPGAEVAAQTMWRAGVWLMPFAAAELALAAPVVWKLNDVIIQVACILGGGVVAYACWNNALRLWPASRVFLFNNLIPISTMTWSHLCLGETVTKTFWVAMLLILAGVALGQIGFLKFEQKVLPPD